MAVATKDELARNLYRARALLRLFEGQFESVLLPFIDSALERHYGAEQIAEWDKQGISTRFLGAAMEKEGR